MILFPSREFLLRLLGAATLCVFHASAVSRFIWCLSASEFIWIVILSTSNRLGLFLNCTYNSVNARMQKCVAPLAQICMSLHCTSAYTIVKRL
ncbi:hypothetical protein LOK49_LG03G01021 [Camellia lanceoleosa]|uniref:Uncharacterized protein n=1 Tax=Camellia lanceoleosa TaxID=1840588 RepID=A0ACC0I6C5_9ERIC|nr:hypothetical protein LOK49_LG03G01021 [Camellia lanceoleosa]